ncbi:hypothetical protein MRB53_038806 [Persea americana]|nr:hypothetical protein MRB53_038806 [Persea americana]
MTSTLPLHATKKVDIGALSNHGPRELATYLRGLSAEIGEDVVRSQLIDAVACDEAHHAIFAVWLGVCKSPQSLVQAVTQEESVFIRQHGIKRVGKAFNRPGWRTVWDAFGGVPGLIELFSRLSELEVKTFCTTIGGAATNVSEERATVTTELLQSLCSLPGAPVQSIDRRPLLIYYKSLLPCCTSDFVREVFQSANSVLAPQAIPQRLVRNHLVTMKQYAIDAVFNRSRKGNHLREILEYLLFNIPEAPGNESRMSASMEFSITFLELLAANPTAECSPDEDDIVKRLLSRAVKRRVSWDRINEIISIYFERLERQTKLPWHPFQDAFLKQLIDFNLRRSDLFLNQLKRYLEIYAQKATTSLTEAILHSCVKIKEVEARLDVIRLYYRSIVRAVPTTNVQAIQAWNNNLYTRVLPAIPIYARYSILCLHHYHISRPAVDLNKADSGLPAQRFPSHLFWNLPRQDAVRLLKNLLSASSDHAFLDGSMRSPYDNAKKNSDTPSELRSVGSRSILQFTQIPNEQNFNSVLLLALLERGDQDALERTIATIADLKKKASTSGEQSERAQYAQAVIYLAISSGSLEIYGEANIWTRRFLRDALTMNALTHRFVVNANEGIDLLAAIPQEAPESVSIRDLSVKVECANGILLDYFETMKLGRKEPHYKESNFASYSQVFASVVQRRIQLATALQPSLKATDAEMYGAIWVSTFDMLTKVESTHLRSIYGAVLILLRTLRPTTLASLARVLMDAVAAKAGAEEKVEDDTLERLTYEILQLLVACDRPMLASSLVLKAVIQNPEASSWHRRLLPLTFFKRLSAHDAHHVLDSFATAIGEKLHEGQKRKLDDKGEPANETQPPSVKVSTVKYLAQLLDSAQFITEQAAVDVLAKLFRTARHIDIRKATLAAIISRLMNNANGGSESLTAQLLGVMESVVPIAGSLNERKPMSEKAWQAAESTLTLPEVWDYDSAYPPLLDDVISAVESIKTKSKAEALHDKLWERVLEPIVERLRENQVRWITLFAEKEGLATVKPLFPLQTLLMRLNRGWPDKVPRRWLQLYQEFILFNIAPPAHIRQMSKTIREDPARRTKPEYRLWLSLYDKSQGLWFHPEQHVATLLQRKLSKDDEMSATGLSAAFVSELVLEQARLLLQNFDTYLPKWKDFIVPLAHPRLHASKEIYAAWDANCVPVIQDLVKLIDDARSPAWQNDPNRSPAVLPSTLKLRLWLLPWPRPHEAHKMHSACFDLADALRTFLGSVGLSYDLPREDIEQLYDVEKYLDHVPRVHVAYRLGMVAAGDAATTSADYWRVELAAKLWNGTSKTVREREDLLPFMEDVVRSWSKSRNEQFRIKAVKWTW